MQNDYILIENLHKKIKNRIILNNINVSIAQGECIELTGNNAAGKSMFLKSIASLINYDSGKILINGTHVGFNKKRETDIGILIESPGFWPHFSGMKNLLMLASLRKKIGIDQIIYYMDLLGLDPHDKLAYCKYSLGMKQKLGIVQAIMESPELILLDEPTCNLDETSVIHVRRLVNEIHKKGATIIITSHNREDLNSICTRKLTISNGLLREVF